MTDQTSERAFESAVESMLVDGGWHQGQCRLSGMWSGHVFPSGVVAFLQAGQPEVVEAVGRSASVRVWVRWLLTSW